MSAEKEAGDSAGGDSRAANGVSNQLATIPYSQPVVCGLDGRVKIDPTDSGTALRGCFMLYKTGVLSALPRGATYVVSPDGTPPTIRTTTSPSAGYYFNTFCAKKYASLGRSLRETRFCVLSAESNSAPSALTADRTMLSTNGNRNKGSQNAS